MISAVAVAEPVQAAAGLASVVAAAVGGGKTAADVDVATNARNSRITLILLTLTGISPQTSGNALGLLCAHMSYSYKTAAVVAAEEVTRVTKEATRTEPPAVYPQRIRTLTTPLTRRMRRPTSRLCPKFLSEDPRTAAVLVVAPTIPDSWGPMAHIQCKQSFRVHGVLVPNSTIPRKLSLATLAYTKLTTMPTPRVLARIRAWLNFLENTAQYLPFCRVSTKTRCPSDCICATTFTCPTTGNSVVLVADQVLWFGNNLHGSFINPHQIRAYGYGVCDDTWDRTDHLALIWNQSSFHLPFQDRIFYSSHAYQLIGKCRLYRLLKSLRRLGIPQTCTGLHRARIQCMLSTVYRPLGGIYGPH